MPSERWRDRILLTRQGGVLDPRTIAGLALWYQASDLLNGGGLPANNAAVSTWKDKSGSSHNLTQATGSLQPVFKIAGFQGKPAVLFSGSPSTQNNLVSGALNFSQPGTVFAACKFGSLSNAQYLMDGATNRWQTANNNPGSSTTWTVYAGGAGEIFTVPNNSLASPCILTWTYNGASSIGRLNGAQVGSGNPGTSALDTLSVGGRDGLGGLGFNGPIAELIFYTATLSAQDMSRVEIYLGASYNIRVS